MRRVVILAAALAVFSAASAQTGPRSAPPPYSTGDQWPRAGDRFYYAVQTPAGPGRTRYTYVDAVPDGHAGWTVTVACGEHDARTGRETSRHVARGTAGRGRMPAIGGAAAFPDGTRLSFLIGQEPGSDALDLTSEFTDARCASGLGQISTGD
ncbi:MULTISPECIES: hypothetical protein [Methylobacteriaceae]|uniref:hypothetical protein n=1 Tax=Methylobacteriaceae TaxID=119045 RepID=UPI000CDB4F5A|nr:MULTISPECIES: hypothetical protein [Methylobacteriaceae]MCP1549444.1 hypothetical protein [Methylorubrum zatmanii]MCP1553943.1 hypothetical protein [Methylorubrum extorquens]MCP1579746.1 hypothetical protein [Methylorubrum extorquens]POR41000.1 hypothetical protein CRT23_21145 [Methylobacterium sp. V23]